MSTEISPEHRARLEALMTKMAPLVRKAIEIAGEFNITSLKSPLKFPEHEKTFDLLIRPSDYLDHVKPTSVITYQEVETKAKALYVAFHLVSDEKNVAQDNWEFVRRLAIKDPQGSYAKAYTGWIAAAREALS